MVVKLFVRKAMSFASGCETYVHVTSFGLAAIDL
jgi:hypothetical protein